MSLNASSNQTARASNFRTNRTPGNVPSTSHPPSTTNAPTLSQHASGSSPGNANADAALTSEQRNSLTVLRDTAHALRWPAKGDDATEDADVLGYFDSLWTNAAHLHQVRQQHPEAPLLASCIKALEGALGRIDTALQRGHLDAEDFDTDALKTIFGALSALADPARAPLINRNQRRALQPLLQGVTSRLLLAHKAGFASAAGAGEHLPLLNWICRGVKKGVLKQDADIAALFEAALDGLAGWIGSEDQEASSYQIGECATILNTVIEYDLLLLRANKDKAEELSDKLSRCALQLCGDETFRLLEKPPVNGVAVVNLCNLVKELIEAGALSFDNPQLPAQLRRLLTLIAGIPNEQMSGGDGRVLSNVGNFLRLLMQRKLADEAAGKELTGMVVAAVRRVLAALNAEAFGKVGKNAQSLSNLASFAQDCHRHLLPGLQDESLRKSFDDALAKLVAKIVATGASAFDDRRAIDGLLAALEYLWSQGLCEEAEGLQALCGALRRKQAELSREKNAAPVQLNAMDAALPALTAVPKLTNQAAPAAEVQPRRIPGDGAIVTPPKVVAVERTVSSSTYLRPVAGKGKFGKAKLATPDARSLAARAALESAGDEDSDAQDEPESSAPQAAPVQDASARSKDGGKARGKHPASRGAAGRGKATHHGPRAGVSAGRGNTRTNAGDANVEPLPARHEPDAVALMTAIRSGNVKGMEDMLQNLRSRAGNAVPLLPEEFLVEAGRGKFFNDRGRAKAMDAYLRFLDKAGKEQLATQLEKSASISSAMHELLVRNGIRNRYGLMQYDAFLKEIRHVISVESETNDPTQELSRILAQADEACIRKLAREHGNILGAAPAALLRLEKDAPIGWFLSAIDDGEVRDALMQQDMCELIRKGYEDQALERLLRHGGTNWLYLPTLKMSLSPRIAKAPFYSLPMYAIAYARRSAVKLMLQNAPKLFAERHLFGFSVLSAALLKDDQDIFQDLLAGLHPDVLDALATEPVLSPEEAMFRGTSTRGASNRTLTINLDGHSGFTLKNMPGFNLLAFASASEAVGCLRILLSHDDGRIARQTSMEHWEEIFMWPHLEPAVKDILEDFVVDQLCRCVQHIDLIDEPAQWMCRAQHLFVNAKSAKGISRPMRLAVEHGHEDMARLLLENASRAQLDALKKEANASEWTDVFPGIGEPMLALLKAAEDRADANDRAAPAHSSASASSRAPQSLQ